MAIGHAAPVGKRQLRNRAMVRAGDAGIVDEQVETVPAEQRKGFLDRGFVGDIAENGLNALRNISRFAEVERGDLETVVGQFGADTASDQAGTAGDDGSLHRDLPKAQTQPCNSRRTTVSSTLMPSTLSLRQGICTNFSPP